MYETIPEITIPIPANGQYQFYIVVGNKKKRLISITGAYTGTYNLDEFLCWGGSNSMAYYIDETQNRGTPYGIFYGHLYDWFEAPCSMQFVVSAFAVPGNVTVRLRFETVSREEEAPTSVSIKESVRIHTRPHLW